MSNDGEDMGAEHGDASWAWYLPALRATLGQAHADVLSAGSEDVNNHHAVLMEQTDHETYVVRAEEAGFSLWVLNHPGGHQGDQERLEFVPWEVLDMLVRARAAVGTARPNT